MTRPVMSRPVRVCGLVAGAGVMAVAAAVASPLPVVCCFAVGAVFVVLSMACRSRDRPSGFTVRDACGLVVPVDDAALMPDPRGLPRSWLLRLPAGVSLTMPITLEIAFQPPKSVVAVAFMQYHGDGDSKGRC